MQRCRTSHQIAQVQHIKTIGVGKHGTRYKVFWDLKQDGKYSNKSTWKLIRERKPTDHNIAQISYSEGYSMRLHGKLLKENQCDMFFFMEIQRNMYGITLEGHWESEFRHTIRHTIYNRCNQNSNNSIHKLVLQTMPGLIYWEIWKQRCECNHGGKMNFNRYMIIQHIGWNIQNTITKAYAEVGLTLPWITL
ncbi:uncharacterized protein LOC124887623 [Capsicum annuum]|uniref:uncharacterized protein LOC124887623 n=1 Tax=Capsicum annuum TaxID=4072 RepID=UPI001FB0D8B0|nr:uncharacterized protein LOC124887623 [Capsicum annuum]